MPEILKLQLDERIKIYAFLKMIFNTEPSLELLGFLQTPEVMSSLRSSGIHLDVKDLKEFQLLIIKEDYRRLFIGPQKHIALNESVYTEKTPQFWGESTVEIKKFIDFVGLTLDEKWQQMPDHISVEFELMQKLYEAEKEALENNDESTARQCSNAANNLFNDHILKWVPEVCDQIIERAQTSVYKALGLWTKTFLQMH